MKLLAQCAMAAWRNVLHCHGVLIAWLTVRPILLLALVPPYLIATTVVAFLCSKIAIPMVFLISKLGLFEQTPPASLNYETAKAFFLLTASLLWLHYLLVAAWCLKEAIRLRMTILGVTQLVLVVVLIFAAAHYYVALLSDEAYTAAAHLPIPKEGWKDADLIDRLSFAPTLETIVDFIYFSTATTATVGYGDIAPLTTLARIVTVVQIGVSFLLVAVALGWIIGKTLNSPAGES
jgi:hypothetical protein